MAGRPHPSQQTGHRIGNYVTTDNDFVVW